MKATISHGVSDHGVPYVELLIEPEYDFSITFRKYYRRVFVGVEDYRGDQSSGVDLEDCWTAPTYIIQKTLIEEFDPLKAYMNALTFLGEVGGTDWDEPDYWKTHYEEQFDEVAETVKEWQSLKPKTLIQI